MNTVIVRCSEIGSKSGNVRSKMQQALRQRVHNRLEYEGFDFDKVKTSRGRIIVENIDEEAAESVADIPGIASASPCVKTDSDLESIKEASEDLEIGDTFGIEANRSGEHDFDSQDVNVEIGSYIEDLTGASVDLDNPDTWVGIDVRKDTTYLFTETFDGVSGLPVGVESSLAALISGGIDSPVSAFEVMRRGSSIVPIYFYNKPLAAEDHVMRFEAAVKELKKYHPSKDWHYYRIDMEEVNRDLMDDVDRGRMILHRALMFKVAEEIAEDENLKGLVTGEAMGQKSSQTPANLRITSSEIDMPVHRPLLTEDKNDIIERAKDLGTFELAEIDSACRSISPDSPATDLKKRHFEELKKEVDFAALVDKAVSTAEKVRI
jgi:thiamine biosynthesis protein ThiI